MNVRRVAVAIAASACLTLGATACSNDSGTGADPEPKAGTKASASASASGGNSAEAACKAAMTEQVERLATDPNAVEDDAGTPKPCRSLPTDRIKALSATVMEEQAKKSKKDAEDALDGVVEPAVTGPTQLKQGQFYRWPDGLTAAVVKAERVQVGGFKDSEVPFRLHIRFENRGKAPVSLDKFSTIAVGATNGGEAAATGFSGPDNEITGRLAPGVKVTKTEDNVIDEKFGNKLIVTMQRVTNDEVAVEDPESTATIR